MKRSWAVAAFLVLAIPVAALCAEAAAKPDAGSAMRRAELLGLSGDYEQAATVLSAALDADPGNVNLTKALAVARIHAGQGAGAAALLEALPPGEAASPETLLWMVLVSSTDGDYGKARSLMKQAFKAAGDDETALYDLAEEFLRAGAPSISMAAYRRILEVNPKDSMFDLNSRLHLAMLYHLDGRDAESVSLLAPARKAFEYSDTEIMTLQELDYLVGYFKGLAAISAGDLAGGVNILRDAQAPMPRGMIAEGAIVKSLDRAGKTAEADSVYALMARRLRSGVAESPESSEPYRNMAIFAAASGRGLEEGLEAAEWALRIEPLSADSMNVKASLLLALGRLGEALAAQNEAIAMATGPRWSEAGKLDMFARQRIDILRKLGRSVPQALVSLPEPVAAPTLESTAPAVETTPQKPAVDTTAAR